MWGIFKGKIATEADPEQIIAETIFEMQEQLVELRRAIAETIATQNITRKQLNNHLCKAKQWHDRAKLALEKGNEALARAALEKRQPYQNSAQKLQTQFDEQQKILDGFLQDLHYLENKINLAKAKQNSYQIKARSAFRTKKIDWGDRSN